MVNSNLLRKSLVVGLVIAGFWLLIFVLFFFIICIGGPRMDCLIFTGLADIPGLFIDKIFTLSLNPYFRFIISFVIWFLIGSIIGFLIFKTKLKKNLNNKSKKPIKNKNN